jgi:hypothetical protein
VKRPIVAMALALTGCGWGNLSNQDLDFYAALPARADLQSKLPTGTTSGALQQGLNAGSKSELYENVKNGSAGFNEGIKLAVGLVEFVRSIAPTRREGSDKRIWGPFPDRARAGWDIQAVMTRVEGQTFDFTFQFQKHGTDGPWIDAFIGRLSASEKSGRGHGSFKVLYKAARDAGVPALPDEVNKDTLSVAYNLDAFPATVELTQTDVNGNTFSYKYRELADTSGSIIFRLDLGSGDIQQIEITSRWLGKGDGIGTWGVTRASSAFWLGITKEECWDSRFLVTYSSAESWANPPKAACGARSACPVLPAGL